MVASELAEVVVAAAELFAVEEPEALVEGDEQPASAKLPHSRKAPIARAIVFVRRDVMFFKSFPFVG